MRIMQKVMMMFESDDHPLTIKSPSPSESFTTRRGRATGESFLCGLLASRFRKAKTETVVRNLVYKFGKRRITEPIAFKKIMLS